MKASTGQMSALPLIAFHISFLIGMFSWSIPYLNDKEQPSKRNAISKVVPAISIACGLLALSGIWVTPLGKPLVAFGLIAIQFIAFVIYGAIQK